MIYNKINDFCKVKNLGSCRLNGKTPTPRVQFLINLLKSENIDYQLDEFGSDENKYYNIIMKGSSSQMIMAHHDIVNPNSDNANDNSASVINVIATKKLRPNVNAVIVDGEEIGGIGSTRVAEQINNGDFGQIDCVLNY